MTTLVVAMLSLREVSRRRTALVLVITLPFWFYVVRRDAAGQSTRMLAIGIGWAVSTLTLFVVNAARGLDPRLRLTGAPVAGIIGGRILAMTGVGYALALVYWALVTVDQNLRHPWATGPMMLLTATVAAPFGGLIAAVLPRELEGALALLTVSAVQLLANPDGTIAKLIPFWSAREIANYAVDGTGVGDMWRGLIHAAVTWLLCTAATLILFARRLYLARYPEP